MRRVIMQQFNPLCSFSGCSKLATVRVQRNTVQTHSCDDPTHLETVKLFFPKQHQHPITVVPATPQHRRYTA